MENFVDAFGKAIESNINKNWKKKQRLRFKTLLEKICDSEIKKIFYNEIPKHISQLKMDILLSISLTKEYQKDNIEINFIIIQTESYSLLPLKKGIEFINPISQEKLLFNKDYIIKRIINNVGLMNAYYKTIQKFVTNKFDRKNLKEKIVEIVKKMNIYFCDLPKRTLGITICNGNIFLQGKYLQESLHKSKIPFYNFTAISKMFLTLLHEIAHQIQYNTSKEYKNIDETNYFIKTFYFKEENDTYFDLIESIELDENCDYYEKNKINPLDDKVVEYVREYNSLHGNQTPCESGEFLIKKFILGKS